MKTENYSVSFRSKVWLFVFGSLLGVVIEGIYCKIFNGHWETHVVSMFAPLCILYGFGAVGFYVGDLKMRDCRLATRFLVFALIGTVVELICGLILEFGLNMYAWDYSRQFLNFRGIVCPLMSAAWGVLGVLFGKLVPVISSVLSKMDGSVWATAATVLTVVLAADLLFTATCIFRWSRRHVGVPAANKIEEQIDKTFTDDFMANRFVEWHFIDE